MWKTLHARYADDITSRDPNARVISYSRFTQYVHFHYPGVRLTRSAEDVCDCCVRLKVQLSRDDISEEERVELCKAKNMHLSAAIAQRRFVSTFIKSYVAVHAPHQAAVGDALPDVYDEAHLEPLVPISYHDERRDEQPATSAPPPIVLIQSEDFGGGISMPHYGHTRPSVDYFNSNLIIQNFVVADITNGTNYVYFYDERAQGKGADAFCSLRLLYHLTALPKSVSDGTAAPEISFSVLDNCVGQNKSRVVMMFFAFLSVVFPYKKVVLCFLLPGHSHNIADRVVAWCRGATRGQNFYTPKDLVKEVNNIHSVEGVFLDHSDLARPFFTDWEPLLSKYFAPPPPGYTANYLFEFDSGVCTARALVDTSDEEAVTFAMVRPGMIDGVVHGVLHDLFGPSVTDIRQASIKDVQLPRHSVRELTAKKLASLSAKYFSIPPPFLGYYPSVPEAIVRAGDDDVSQLAQTDTTTEPKKKVGRPRTKKPRILPKQPSILQ
ncbi:hypothetical protein PR001_g29887, partial [Phytophthora rubi]